MSKLANILPEKVGDVKEILTVDGIGITSKQGWVLVRPSGTEPVIRITCEGQSRKAADEILKTTEELVRTTVASA